MKLSQFALGFCLAITSIAYASEFQKLDYDLKTNPSPFISGQFAGNQCSGTWLSNDGLLLTAVHCIESCLALGGTYNYENSILTQTELAERKWIHRNGRTVPFSVVEADLQAMKNIRCPLRGGFEYQILSLGSNSWITTYMQPYMREQDPTLYDFLIEKGFVGIGSYGDFALLKVQKAEKDKYPLEKKDEYFSWPPTCMKLRTSELKIGEKVWNLSFPAITRRPNQERSLYQPRVSSGEVVDRKNHPLFGNELEEYLKSDPYSIAVSTDAEGGSSGSSIFDENGEISGLTYATLGPKDSYQHGSTLVISSRFLLEKFRKDLGGEFVDNLVKSCIPTSQTNDLIKMIQKNHD